jgi:carboxypeptidase Q
VKDAKSPLNNAAYKRLAYYVDTFGPRMWGSDDMADAVDTLYDDLN